MQPLWRAEERHRGCTHAAVDFHTSHHIINFEGQHLVHVHTVFTLASFSWSRGGTHTALTDTVQSRHIPQQTNTYISGSQPDIVDAGKSRQV